MGKEEMHTKFQFQEPERKKLLRTSRCRWDDNIRMDLKETRRRGLDCIQLGEDIGR
jgi:restriction endonuclease Mrr